MNAFMLAHFGITEFWTFLLGTIFIVLLPGPNSMYVLSVAAQRGVRAGYKGACGVFLGDAILMVLSAAGVASAAPAPPADGNRCSGRFIASAAFSSVPSRASPSRSRAWCSGSCGRSSPGAPARSRARTSAG